MSKNDKVHFWAGVFAFLIIVYSIYLLFLIRLNKIDEGVVSLSVAEQLFLQEIGLAKERTKDPCQLYILETIKAPEGSKHKDTFVFLGKVLNDENASRFYAKVKEDEGKIELWLGYPFWKKIGEKNIGPCEKPVR